MYESLEPFSKDEITSILDETYMYQKVYLTHTRAFEPVFNVIKISYLELF